MFSWFGTWLGIVQNEGRWFRFIFVSLPLSLCFPQRGRGEVQLMLSFRLAPLSKRPRLSHLIFSLALLSFLSFIFVLSVPFSSLFVSVSLFLVPLRPSLALAWAQRREG